MEKINKRVITELTLSQFKDEMYRNEKRQNTIEKYIRDIRKLKDYAGTREITKELLVGYKEELERGGKYCTSSINSFLAAANCFCTVMGWTDVRVKMVRIQRDAFVPENQELSKDEYEKLIKAALRKGDERLALLMQTLGGTGIRISELSFITVESLRKGMTDIYNKGKARRILYPTKLIQALQSYVRRNNIKKGCIFCTMYGMPMDRSNIWKAMKRLCASAGVSKEKVFPHNIRHLFARCFYQVKPDIARLADVLGHCNIETTRIYIKSTGKEHKEHLNRMHMLATCYPEWIQVARNKKRICTT